MLAFTIKSITFERMGGGGDGPVFSMNRISQKCREIVSFYFCLYFAKNVGKICRNVAEENKIICNISLIAKLENTYFVHTLIMMLFTVQYTFPKIAGGAEFKST